MADEVEAHGLHNKVEEIFKATLIHGRTKYEIELAQNTSKATINDLSDRVFDLTQVPKSRQRLIYKGKSLTNYEETLEKCGLCSGSKLMLIGKKHDPEEQKNLSSLLMMEKKVDTIENIYVKLDKHYQSLKQGFLDKSKLKESFRQLEKDYKSTDEDLMKSIEILDSMEIDSSFKDAKLKRKNLIKKIQKLHDDIDQLEQSSKEYCKANFLE